MTEEKTEWLGCPNSVKEQLPAKIRQAVNYAMDECFRDIVGEPAAQRDQWLYKEIHKRVCDAMQQWVENGIDDALTDILELVNEE